MAHAEKIMAMETPLISAKKGLTFSLFLLGILIFFARQDGDRIPTGSLTFRLDQIPAHAHPSGKKAGEPDLILV